MAEQQRELADEDATRALGAQMAGALDDGLVVYLRGELGAGKTSFARAFIQARGGDETVPSPTFTLVETYDLPGGPIWHFDLYRLRAPEEAWELGIEEAFHAGISLIEWPERLESLLPSRHLLIAIGLVADPCARRASLSGDGEWTARLAGIAAEA